MMEQETIPAEEYIEIYIVLMYNYQYPNGNNIKFSSTSKEDCEAFIRDNKSFYDVKEVDSILVKIAPLYANFDLFM